MNKKVKLSQLTPYEVIMSMVNGLRQPKTVIHMTTFGIKHANGVCFGCAATNAILHLFDCKAEEYIDSAGRNLNALLDKNVNTYAELDHFESAINMLRSGRLARCNVLLANVGIGPIYNPNNLYLPHLGSFYSADQVDIYEQLANDNNTDLK